MPEKPSELDEIRKKLAEIDRKLDQLMSFRPRLPQAKETVPHTLASLPEHLKRTAFTIARMGEATAEKVATETGRSRAAESDYLNQLANQGFLKKERKERQMHFRVFALYTTCPQCGANVQINAENCPMCGARLSDKH
jgi:response regulator of citrate/malate metabolism